MFLTSLPNSFRLTHPHSLCISCISFSYAISLSDTDCLLSFTFRPTHPTAVTYTPDNLFVTSYIVQCTTLRALTHFIVPLPLYSALHWQPWPAS
jgi:hypothetical protein